MVVNGGGIPVSLGEVLEVRGRALAEDEVWAILSRGISALQKLLENADIPPCGVSTETILFYPDGSVVLKPADSVPVLEGDDTSEELKVFGPTESELTSYLSSSSKSSLEKIYTYSFGGAMNYALVYGDEPISSSPELFSLLNLMTLVLVDTRPGLAKIAQMVSNKLLSRSIDPYDVITTMYTSIMGSDEDLHMFHGGFDDDEPKKPEIDVGTQSTPRKDLREESTSPFPIRPSGQFGIDGVVNHESHGLNYSEEVPELYQNGYPGAKTTNDIDNPKMEKIPMIVPPEPDPATIEPSRIGSFFPHVNNDVSLDRDSGFQQDKSKHSTPFDSDSESDDDDETMASGDVLPSNDIRPPEAINGPSSIVPSVIQPGKGASLNPFDDTDVDAISDDNNNNPFVNNHELSLTGDKTSPYAAPVASVVAEDSRNPFEWSDDTEGVAFENGTDNDDVIINDPFREAGDQRHWMSTPPTTDQTAFPEDAVMDNPWAAIPGANRDNMATADGFLSPVDRLSTPLNDSRVQSPLSPSEAAVSDPFVSSVTSLDDGSVFSDQAVPFDVLKDATPSPPPMSESVLYADTKPGAQHRATDSDSAIASSLTKHFDLSSIGPIAPGPYDRIGAPPELRDYTNPKDHGYIIERSRPYHSMSCSFCSPKRRRMRLCDPRRPIRRSSQTGAAMALPISSEPNLVLLELADTAVLPVLSDDDELEHQLERQPWMSRMRSLKELPSGFIPERLLNRTGFANDSRGAKISRMSESSLEEAFGGSMSVTSDPTFDDGVVEGSGSFEDLGRRHVLRPSMELVDFSIDSPENRSSNMIQGEMKAFTSAAIAKPTTGSVHGVVLEGDDDDDDERPRSYSEDPQILASKSCFATSDVRSISSEPSSSSKPVPRPRNSSGASRQDRSGSGAALSLHSSSAGADSLSGSTGVAHGIPADNDSVQSHPTPTPRSRSRASSGGGRSTEAEVPAVGVLRHIDAFPTEDEDHYAVLQPPRRKSRTDTGNTSLASATHDPFVEEVKEAKVVRQESTGSDPEPFDTVVSKSPTEPAEEPTRHTDDDIAMPLPSREDFQAYAAVTRPELEERTYDTPHTTDGPFTRAEEADKRLQEKPHPPSPTPAFRPNYVGATRGSFTRRGSARKSGTGSGRRVAQRSGGSISSESPSRQPLGRPKGMAGPEFLYRSRMPSIRLKAATLTKKHALWKPGYGGRTVLVLLLNGQRIEVSCTTNTTAEEIFDTVVAHSNLSENYFFGLTYLKDGEHFFLEPEQKIGKVAPADWRDQKGTLHARVQFTLFLRIKYYPNKLEYVRNAQTLHQLYLQLRRDLIDERLQCDRDKVYQLAALALQAEYGDRPTSTSEDDYFQLDHYLPQRHLADEFSISNRVQQMLSELHSQYAGLSNSEAESEFLRECQALREYGIHFHRLFKSKPQHSHAPDPIGDPDTGTNIWVGIMPRGIIIFEERCGERIPISQHPWHSTQTLKFHRKKFTIVPYGSTPIDDNGIITPAPHLVYYTDSHKKSGYYVRFAATQHRFCMKMRALEKGIVEASGTLERPPKGSRLVDSSSPARSAQAKDGSFSSDKRSLTGSGGVSRDASHSSHTAFPDSSEPFQKMKPLPASPQDHRNESISSSRNDAGATKSESQSRFDSTSGRPDVRGSGDSSSPRTRNERSDATTRDPAHFVNNATSDWDSGLSSSQYPHALNVSVPSHNETLAPPADETISDSLRERFNETGLSPPRPGDPSPSHHQHHRSGVPIDPTENSSIDGLISTSEYDLFTAHLVKDTHFGLGLTLVDGEIQGIKGVYVKSVTAGGPAETNGRLRIGDRLVAVNGENLEGKNRHDAVDLVRRSSAEVQMQIMRLRCLYSSEESLTASSPSDVRGRTLPPGYTTADIDSGLAAVGSDRNDSSHLGVPPSGNTGYPRGNYFSQPRHPSDILYGLSRNSATLPSNVTAPSGASSKSRHRHGSKSSQSSDDSSDAGRSSDEDSDHIRYAEYHVTPNHHGSASRFGSSYIEDRIDTELRSANSSANIRENLALDADHRANTTRIGSPYASSTPIHSHLDQSNGDGGVVPGSSDVTKDEPRRFAAIYGDDLHDSEVPDSEITLNGDSSAHRHHPSNVIGGSSSFASQNRSFEEQSKENSQSRPEIVDWTDELRVEDVDLDAENEERVTVELFKNERGGLGIKVAGGGTGHKRIYVKALVGEPALSCPDIRPGDKVISVNSRDTRAITHQEVVALLKAAQSPVVLGLSRPKRSSDGVSESTMGRSIDYEDFSDEEDDDGAGWETLHVDLEKPVTGSLGLSLARPTGTANSSIYVRLITPGSVADKDGRLRVNDRLWAINGESVADATPAEVVQKLKAADGIVELVVKRERSQVTKNH